MTKLLDELTAMKDALAKAEERVSVLTQEPAPPRKRKLPEIWVEVPKCFERLRIIFLIL